MSLAPLPTVFTMDALPQVSSVADCVGFYWETLTTQQRCGIRRLACRSWSVGTACSGTDSAIKVLEQIGRSSGWEFTHTFSCELDTDKQAWVRENCPNVPFIFPDICELHTGRCVDVISGVEVDVPPVDIFIAGFVCKSVSSENTQRGTHAACIAEGTGKTGTTFDGLRRYVQNVRPKLVICENVPGLLKRNRGSESQLHSVARVFESLGYHFAHKLLDARSYLVPQRRHRVWMWAIRSDVSAARAAEHTAAILTQMGRPAPLSLTAFLAAADGDVQPRQCLNQREEEAIDDLFNSTRSLQRLSGEELEDLVVDISKSAGRLPWCLDATPCVLPGSRLFWRRRRWVLGAREVAALQGIWPRDFPALTAWCEHRHRSRVLIDMAGNAFTSTICTAVCIAVMAAISPC